MFKTRIFTPIVNRTRLPEYTLRNLSLYTLLPLVSKVYISDPKVCPIVDCHFIEDDSPLLIVKSKDASILDSKHRVNIKLINGYYYHYFDLSDYKSCVEAFKEGEFYKYPHKCKQAVIDNLIIDPHYMYGDISFSFYLKCRLVVLLDLKISINNNPFEVIKSLFIEKLSENLGERIPSKEIKYIPNLEAEKNLVF